MKLKQLINLRVLTTILFFNCTVNLQAQEFGINGQEITKIEDTGHNVQVWEILSENNLNSEYEISIKHAVAGDKGSFYIIAWADTDNNGIPDKEIGRSDLKTALHDGDWSSWRFKKDYERVFVGNTWNRSDEKMYYQMGGTVNGYKGLSNTVFFSRAFNGIPNQSTGPRYTNIKIKPVQNIECFAITSQEVTKIEDTGHNVQVWEILSDNSLNEAYEISIKHAVAGDKGSFYIIAWADTDNNGIPDKEIGRSELKTASRDGDWSTWKFNSAYAKIFVGNTWNKPDEKMYYQMGGTVNGYKGLSNTVFFSRTFNGIPNQSTGPRYTNIKVCMVNGN
jgi:hypothetical protein